MPGRGARLSRLILRRAVMKLSRSEAAPLVTLEPGLRSFAELARGDLTPVS
jgi:hypothetical protein